MENTGDTYRGHSATARGQLTGVHSCLSHGDITTLSDLCLPLEGCKHSGAVPPSPQGHLSPNNSTWIPPKPRIVGHRPRGAKPLSPLSKENPQIVPQRRQRGGLQLPGIAQSQTGSLSPHSPRGRGQGSGGSILPRGKSPRTSPAHSHRARAQCHITRRDRESPTSHPWGQGEHHIPSMGLGRASHPIHREGESITSHPELQIPPIQAGRAPHPIQAGRAPHPAPVDTSSPYGTSKPCWPGPLLERY